MGKKVKRSKTTPQQDEVAETKRKLSKTSKQESVHEEEQEESQTILSKKEMKQLFQKTKKSMDASVKESLELKQVIKAVEQLQGFNKKALEGKKKQLLEDEEDFVYVNFTMSQLPTKPSPKPHFIELKTPIYTSEHKSRVCLFVKDPAREFKDEIQDMDIPCVAKVIGFDKLRREFKQFKDKRQLLKDYDIFAADLRIYKMLPAVAGREFYRNKAFPVPVKLHGLEKEKLEEQLNGITACSVFMMGNGPNYSVRVGRTSMSAKEVAKNVEMALGEMLAYVAMHDDIKFEKVQQVTVSTRKCPVELPVLNQLTASEKKAFMEVE